jgi:RND superfamily putative drug exporter
MIGPLRNAELRTGRAFGHALAELGSFCWKHARIVLFLWLLAAIAAGVFTGKLTERLLSGAGDITGSTSLKVDQLLRSDFGRGDAQSLILVFRSASVDKKPAELSALFDDLKRRLTTGLPIGQALSERDIEDARLIPKAGAGHLILIEPKTEGLQATEQQVSKIRAAVRPAFEAAKARHGDLEWAITGRAALTDDLNRFDAEDTARAEIRALPLSLLILIAAFGSVMSSMLPLLLALASRTVVLGVIFVLAGTFEIANLVLSVVTMLSISLGIDYCLFLLHRYRRELQRIETEDPGIRGLRREELAMRSAMTQSGSAVFYSAAIVAIGIGSLLATPLMQTRSVGLGGLLAVLVTLAGSLTLVPAILRLVRPSTLEWPAFISRHTTGEQSRRLWRRWAKVVERNPVLAIATSLALLLAMAAPALHTRVGFPESEFLPPELEFSKGLRMLDRMQLKGLLSPIIVIVSDTEGKPALDPDRAPILADFAARLEKERAVRFVQGPIAPSKAQGDSGTLGEAVGGALQRDAFISRGRDKLLFLVVPSGDSTLTELRELSGRLPAWLNADGLSVEVGGQAQYYNDFDEAVMASYPRTVGLVLCMSALALLLLFRAPLASAKAIVLNLCSVAAGYGIVVLVFQLGHGSEFFGVEAPTEVVPITVPLLIFCFLFGLSMDYEIFLLSRVRTIFDETGDNARSIGEGLADTGAVITSAALIMVAVFGAFAFARDVIVQMIGLGLAVAVFVDATVIRSALGPALMQVAGRWNWWPSRSARVHADAAQSNRKSVES